MHKSSKPVRKCHGCILNLGGQCAVYEDPHARWHHSRCSHYDDKELYNKYLEEQKRQSQNKTKEQRKSEAKLHNTEEHHDGMKGRM